MFAADAVARLTGVPGVAAVTAGPGVTNTITALKNAQMAQSPLVLLGGATATLLRGRGALQDVDQMALVGPHVKRASRVTRVRDLGPALDEAFRLARHGVPGPVFLECPVDLLYPEALVREWYGVEGGEAGRARLGDRARQWYVGRHLRRLFDGVGPAPAGAPPAVPAPEPDEARVRRAAALLSRAERPVLLVGSQALLSAAEADALADAVRALRVPVYLSGMARGLLGAGDPLQARHKRKEALREADLVILAGVPCDFRLDYGRHIGRGAVLVSANRSRDEIAQEPAPGARRPRRARALPARPRPRRLRPAAGVDALARGAARARRGAGRRDRRPGGGGGPGRAQPAAALPCARGGARRRQRDRGRRRRLRLDRLVRPAPAPAALLARPRAPSARSGSAPASRSARSWCALRPTSGSSTATARSATAWPRPTPSRATASASSRVIGNDGAWTQIAREQVEVLHDDVGTVLARADYERAAEGLGARGLRLDEAGRTDAVLREARDLARSGRPVYVNARIGSTDFRKGSISM